ncbi:transglutaminase-like putative cysteine protease [Streptacidiphilus sp. MAP12-16]|uniref:transglutaminase family protein n=1 Tax=Streptacidiphilus sp. MAP12-16 TaxID=3156300 RepID=UPI003515CD8B
MNGRTRIAFSGASATLLTALCLWPLITPAGWLLQAGFLVLVVTCVGLGLRRLPMPRPLTPLLQLLVVVLLLTLFYVSDQAVLHVLPGPKAVLALNGLIRDGITEMGQYAPPAPARPGLQLILVGAVALIGLLVDALAATYQRVALAGLPLLALYSVGTGVHTHGALWFWFLLAAFGYLALLMAEGKDRLSRWGRVFHGTPATLAGTGGGNPLSGTGYRIAALAVAAGLLLPLGLPSLDTGLLGKFGNSGPGLGGNGIITAVNPLASLASSLKNPANQNVISYTTSSSTLGDQYLRIVDLDAFNGVAWTTSSHQVQSVPTPLPYPDGLDPTTPQLAVQTRITTSPDYVQQWLPMPYPAVSVLTNGDWKYEPEGRTLVGADQAQTAGGLQYTVNSLALRPGADQLRSAAAPPADILKSYLGLPKDFPAVVRSDAESVTQSAVTPYDKAVALQRWFTTTGGFSYNTQVPANTGSNAMVDFLRNRQGFCVHFAATMAAMARSLGIPARVSIGFTPGTQQSDGSWVVGTKDAHAWPELYFSGVGWLRFEPTPSRGVAPDYSVPSAAGGTAPRSTATGQASTAPTTSANANAGCPAAERRAGGCRTEGATAQTVASGQSVWPGPLVLAGIVIGLLVLVLLLTPMLWRLRARRSRLRRRPPGSGGPSELSDRQVLAAWQELIDSAWDLGIPPDQAETPRRTAARIVELGELEELPRAAAGRLALAAEQVLYAPRVDTQVALRQDVRAVRDGLRASVSRGTRTRALLFPPSSARLVQSARAGTQAIRRLLSRRPWHREQQ